jgi:hypothetical protein
VRNDKHSVFKFLSRFLIPLCHPPKLLAEYSLTHFRCGWIIHQCLVSGYCFTRDGMQGLVKCSNIIGTLFVMCFMKHVGVNLLLAKTSSWIVSMLIACLVTILCCALLGLAMNVVGKGVVCPLGDLLLTHCVFSFHPTFVAPLHSGQMRVVGAMPGTCLIAGTTPGVLFRVTCQCRWGVIFSARFAVGFRDCIIGGAFVMRDMVRMGVLSITLCCCILTLCSCSVISCPVSRAGGSTICLILFWRILMRRRPLGILFAVAVSLASSSVRAQKCWSGVKLGNWQCCEKSSVDPDMRYALVLGCNRGHIGSGPLMGRGTTH